jgi:hypothetical protein
LLHIILQSIHRNATSLFFIDGRIHLCWSKLRSGSTAVVTDTEVGNFYFVQVKQQ